MRLHGGFVGELPGDYGASGVSGNDYITFSDTSFSAATNFSIKVTLVIGYK